jgi:hypothetical protein
MGPKARVTINRGVPLAYTLIHIIVECLTIVVWAQGNWRFGEFALAREQQLLDGFCVRR